MPRETKSTVQSQITTTVNNDGEVLQEVDSKKFTKQVEPDFVKLYIQDILYLTKLPQGLNGLLMSLLKRMQYDNTLIIIKAIKENIAKELNLSFKTVEQYIGALLKNNILLKLTDERSVYTVNPFYFGKGEWKNIKSLRIIIEYSVLKGRNFEPDIEYKDDTLFDDDNTIKNE